MIQNIIDQIERKKMSRNILVVGAGQMGRGIAQTCIQQGFKVVLLDVAQSMVDLAKQTIVSQWEKGIEKGKWTSEQKSQWEKNLTLTTHWDSFDTHSINFSIEAIKEDKKLKLELFQTLDNKLPQNAILSSNTSSIPITELAASTKRPDKVIGMHFMNPVPVMKLVEIIPGLTTSSETLSVVQSLAQELGKTWVVSKDFPGFIVNRILMPMINEAIYVLHEGIATPKDIDEGMKLGTNVPMGPLELADFIGLDTCLSIMEVLFEGLGDSKYRPCPLLRQYVMANRLGRKSKRGFYDY